MRAPTTVTSDGAPGLIAAINTVFAKSIRIRCWFHYADLRIMPMLNRIPLWGRGFVLARSA